MKHPDEVTQVLEDIEMDLRKGNIDFKQADAARAAALAVSYRLAPKMDAALAACAEMRAALLDWHGPPNPEHSVEHCPTCALLSCTDLGRGMVVEREVLERSGGRIKAALDDIYETWVNADEGGARTCDEATVGALKAVLVDLDALLKKGGGK